MKHNDTLICLNLNNCNLTRHVGKALVQATRENSKIINLDIERNPQLDIDDVREIQKNLEENHAHYLEERKREWQERRNLKGEEVNINNIHKARMIEVDIIDGIRVGAQEQQLKREEIFLKNKDELEEERRRMEKKLEKEMQFRAQKKRRGGMKPR